MGSYWADAAAELDGSLPLVEEEAVDAPEVSEEGRRRGEEEEEADA